MADRAPPRLRWVFERFTERARRVVINAREESWTLGHSYVGTEHLLIGLLRDRDLPAGRILASLGITPNEVRRKARDTVGEGKANTHEQNLPFTPPAKQALQRAFQEMLALQPPPGVCPEHLLLGLLQAEDGLAARILFGSGVDLEKIRDEIARSGPSYQPPARPGDSAS